MAVPLLLVLCVREKNLPPSPCSYSLFLTFLRTGKRTRLKVGIRAQTGAMKTRTALPSHSQLIDRPGIYPAVLLDESRISPTLPVSMSWRWTECVLTRPIVITTCPLLRLLGVSRLPSRRIPSTQIRGVAVNAETPLPDPPVAAPVPFSAYPA